MITNITEMPMRQAVENLADSPMNEHMPRKTQSTKLLIRSASMKICAERIVHVSHLETLPLSSASPLSRALRLLMLLAE